MNPMYVARDLARQLRDDRISSAQIKEFIPVSELIELLGLSDAELLEYLQVDVKKDE
jgi:hypothetical protein